MAQETIRQSLAVPLDDLVLSSSHVEEFLHNLAVAAAADLSSPGQEVSCSVTVLRRKKPATVASSDDRALGLDEVQYAFDEGPCLSAIREGGTMHVPDVRTEHRWPRYIAAVHESPLESVLAVSMLEGGEASAALNLYSTRKHAFSGEAISAAEKFARDASTSLGLALRIAQLTDSRDDLIAAMSSRTIIDLAAGVIMGQNRCSQDAAMTVLKRASSSRNIKLREVAASVVASVTDDPSVTTHYDA
jgi:GAF domain-containing protein